MSSEAAEAAVDRRKTVVGVVVAIAVVAVVFGVVMPNLVDWDQVFSTLGSVPLEDLLVLLGLGVLLYVPAGWLYAAVLPGLGLGRGARAWVATTAVSTTLPGFDLVLRIAMYTSWGFGIETATVAMFLSGLVEMSTKLLLAVVATAVGAAVAADLSLLAIAGIALAAVVAVLVLVVLVVRSETWAQRVGDRLQRIVEWVFSSINRKGPTDVAERVLGARADARSALSDRWHQAVAASFLTQAIVFAILVLSLRAVGLDNEALPLGDILLVHALVVIITSIPITPGSIGVAELAYTALFAAVAGDQNASDYAAAVLLFRAATWLLPIPIGWVVALRWKARSGGSLFPGPAAADAAP